MPDGKELDKKNKTICVCVCVCYFRLMTCLHTETLPDPLNVAHQEANQISIFSLFSAVLLPLPKLSSPDSTFIAFDLH
jgi:hypothetical protein